MSKVNHDKLITRLKICPVVQSNTSKEILCNDCKFVQYDNCVSHLIQESADTIESLQETVNIYSTYDTFLYSHGCFHTNPEDSARS